MVLLLRFTFRPHHLDAHKISSIQYVWRERQREREKLALFSCLKFNEHFETEKLPPRVAFTVPLCKSGEGKNDFLMNFIGCNVWIALHIVNCSTTILMKGAHLQEMRFCWRPFSTSEKLFFFAISPSLYRHLSFSFWFLFAVSFELFDCWGFHQKWVLCVKWVFVW